MRDRQISFEDALKMVTYALELAMPIGKQPEPKDFTKMVAVINPDRISHRLEPVPDKDEFDIANKRWRDKRHTIRNERDKIFRKVKRELKY